MNNNDHTAEPEAESATSGLGEGGHIVELQPGMTAEVMGYVPENDAQ
jgi:hypothetical protein